MKMLKQQLLSLIFSGCGCMGRPSQSPSCCADSRAEVPSQPPDSQTHLSTQETPEFVSLISADHNFLES